MYTNSAPLTITGNKRNDLCPICGSGSIEYVQFKPSFIGGDIPRPDSSPLPEEYVEKELEPVQRPHTVGFISNNLIAMIRDETSSN